jgi:hypothetical protein
MPVSEIVEALYRMQCLADPNHPADSMLERLEEMYDIACDIMRRTGYMPD